MAERESKHLVDTYIGSIPHSGLVINTCVYLKGNMKSLNSHRRNKTLIFFFNIALINAPSYVVVVTYAVVHFDLYANDNFFWVCTSLRCWSDSHPPRSPKFRSDMTCVCLISNRNALSFSSWLKATHTIVACRFGKTKYTLSIETDSVAC
jgi:hypothetical protein